MSRRSSPRNILFLIDRLHSTAGGAEKTVARLCNLLPRESFRCSVATFYAGANVEREFPCQVRVLPLKGLCSWSALEQAIALRRLLRSERINLVHTFFPASDIWGALVARVSGCSVVVSSRRDLGILRNHSHRVAYRFVNGLFDQVQAVSENVRDFCITSDHLPPSKVITVYNGVDLAEVDAASPLSDLQSIGLATDARVVLTVANVRAVKGIDVLVQAAAIVKREFPNAVFLVVGEAHYNSYLDQLKKQSKSLGVESTVLFLGARKDVFSLLKSSDLFCLPSRSEGMSNSLLEAMACRKPCVATNVGGNPEAVTDGRTGFIVPPEDPQELAAAILALLREREKARCMGEAGRNVIEQGFTTKNMVDHYSALYDGLLSRAS